MVLVWHCVDTWAMLSIDRGTGAVRDRGAREGQPKNDIWPESRQIVFLAYNFDSVQIQSGILLKLWILEALSSAKESCIQRVTTHDR